MEKKRIWSAVRALFPNVAWDAIKNLDRLAVWIIGGASLIGTVAVSIIQRLQGLPQDLLGILLIAVIWLLILGTVYVVSKVKSRRAQPKSENQAESDKLQSQEQSDAEKSIEPLATQKSELETQIQGLNKDIARLQEDNDKLQFSITERIKELEQWAWLRQIADNDKRNISRYVYIIFRKVSYEGLNAELQKYIEIYFDIINASVYSITIDKTIQGGAVYLNNEELNPNSTTIDGSLHNISRDERGDRPFLVIKLRFTPTEAERIRNPLPEDKLHFNRLWINVKAENTNSDEQPKRLCLPSEIPIVPVPQPHKIITRSLPDEAFRNL